MEKYYLLLVASGVLLMVAMAQLVVPRIREVNVILAVLSGVSFVWMVHAIGYLLGMLSVYPHLNKAYLPFYALTGPLWYAYNRSLVAGKNVTSSDRKHLLPTLFSTLLAIPFFLQSAVYKSQHVETTVSDFSALTIYLATRFAEITMLAYLVLSLVLIHTARAKDKSEQRSHSILIFITAVAIVAASIRISGAIAGSSKFGVFVPVTIILPAFIFFYLSSIRHPFLMGSSVDAARSVRRAKAPTSAGSKRLNGYRERIIENHWHLNPDLKIQELARRLGMPVHDLSELINQESGGNFKTFINALRIKHSTNLLVAGTDQTMVEIAHASGFNSMGVFYAQFKLRESVTPAQYRSNSSSKTRLVVEAETNNFSSEGSGRPDLYNFQS